MAARGSWQLEGGRLEAGGIRLRLVIEPTRHGLPVASGPAVLFGGLSLFGDAGGDIGLSVRVDGLAAVPVGRCNDSACRYEAEIALPTADLPAAIRRLEEHGSLSSVSADLTLARTFGAGTWLQVFPLHPGEEDGPLAEAGGRLGAIAPVAGTLFPFGLFPANEATPVPGEFFASGEELDYRAVVERIRAENDDPTTPLQVASGRLRVVFDPPCDHTATLTMQDDAGNRVFDTDAFEVETVDEDIDIPVGIAWHLTLHDGGGIDLDQGRQGWGVRVGEIVTDGTPIVVDVRFDCREAVGLIRLTGGIAQPTERPATAAPQATEDARPGALGATPVGLIVILLVTGLVLLLGIGASRRQSGP
jgi:hypothetical protein